MIEHHWLSVFLCSGHVLKYHLCHRMNGFDVQNTNKGDKHMYSIHFYENNTYILNQALRNIPAVDENVRIKGRNGKVVNVLQMDENRYFVYVEFEVIVDKRKLTESDLRKKRR